MVLLEKANGLYWHFNGNHWFYWASIVFLAEYYDIKCYILWMHWCTIMKLCMYHWDHDVKVLKKISDSYNEI